MKINIKKEMESNHSSKVTTPKKIDHDVEDELKKLQDLKRKKLELERIKSIKMKQYLNIKMKETREAEEVVVDFTDTPINQQDVLVTEPNLEMEISEI